MGDYYYDNSGVYLCTVLDANDDLETIELVLASLSLGYDIDLLYSSKVDEPDTSSEPGVDFPLYITYYGDGSGTWSTYLGEPPDDVVLLSLYTVKGGNGFAIYLVDPAAADGTWNVGNLMNNGGQIPQISHFSGFSTNIGVPEPASLILLGIGLVGVGVLRRRLKK